MIPMLMHVRVRTSKAHVGFWIPVLPVWILLLVFLLEVFR